MDKKIKVSIVIPIYNAEKYLAECLESLIHQTLKEIEIICVNNGSTDNSQKILEEYAEKDNRINILNNENNGPGAARNFGINAASGEYIGLCDSDDWVDLDFFEKLYNTAEKYNAELVCASMVRARKFHKKFRIKVDKEAVFSEVQEKLEACNAPKMCYVTNKIYKTKALKATGITFREGCFFEDIDYTFKIIYLLEKVAVVPNVYYYYRFNPKSIVKTHNPQKERDKMFAYSEVCRFAKEHNIFLQERYKMKEKKVINFLNIPILKIKIWEDYKKYYLFGFIKIAKIKG